MAKQPLENVVHHLFQVAARIEFRTLNDQQLLQRYLDQRDQLAMGELLRRHEKMVWNVCWRILRHRQDVEDAFQASLMTLIQKAPTVLGTKPIEGWLYSVSYKVATNAKVARIRRHSREERRAKMREESFASHQPDWELHEVLDKELIAIPEKYRNPLILCYLEGMTQKEAAQKLGLSTDALDQRLRRGREYLKKRLTKYGMEWEPALLLPQAVTSLQVPEVTPGLVERTLDMARILTLSNGTWETAGISPQVAVLVKGAMSLWTAKVKILLGLLLTTLAAAGGGMVAYSGWLYLRGEKIKEKRIDNDGKSSNNAKTDRPLPPRVDCYGDSLPLGSLARLGTTRYRPIFDGDNPTVVAFTPDGKYLLTAGKFPCLWDMSTGQRLRQFSDSLHEKRSFGETALSPDGKFVVSRLCRAVGDDDDVYLWESKTGKLRRKWASHRRVGMMNSTCCAFSSDSQALVTCFNDDHHSSKVSLGMWDIATGKRRWEQKLWWEEKNQEGKEEVVCRHCTALAISPDGTLLADGGHDGLSQPSDARKSGIVLRDSRTGRTLHMLGPLWSVKSLAFSPDSRALLVLYEHRDKVGPSVYLWDVATGKENWHSEGKCGGCIAFSPDGTVVAITQAWGWGGSISLREATTGKELRGCQQDTAFNRVNSLAFSPDSKILAAVHSPVGTPGAMIRCWDVASGNILAPHQSFLGHETAVDSVSFLPDGQTLVSGGCNEAAYLWDTRTGRQQFTLRQESRIHSLQFPWSFTPIMGPLAVTAVSPNGKFVAGRRIEVTNQQFNWKTLRRSICVWDAITGRELQNLKFAPKRLAEIPAQMVFSPNSHLLAVCLTPNAPPTRRGRVLLYELVTGKLGHILDGVNPTFSPDNARLLTLQEGILNLWDTVTGKKITSVTLKSKDGHLQLAISRDWRTLAFSDGQGLNLCSLDGDKLMTLRLGPLHATARPIRYSKCLAFSPDGRMLAAAGSDSTIYVWETATGNERIRLSGHHGRIRSLAFSPDSRRLASGSEDTTILVWDLTGRLDERLQLRPAQLSSKTLEKMWGLLAGSDADQARQAIWNLVAARAPTVSFLRKHLQPAPKKHVTEADPVRFIAELDSDIYAIRKKAREQLEGLGESAESSLRQALEKYSTSLEVRRAIQLLLAAIETKQASLPSGKELRELRVIEILEQVGTVEAHRFLTILSRGDPRARLTQEAQASLHRLQQNREHP